MFRLWAGSSYGRRYYPASQHRAFLELIRDRIAISAAAGALVYFKDQQLSVINRVQDNYIYLLKNVKQYFGDSWLIKGLPKNIYTRAKGEADEAMYVHVSSTGEEIDIPIWDYVTLPECKQIILNGKNWSLFFEDTFVRPEEANLVGGKDPKTDWILRVNSISNKLSKESYSVPVDEYSYVKSIYDWLMGILVF